MKLFLIGMLFGLGLHYAVCKYGGCVNGCYCENWKGLK